MTTQSRCPMHGTIPVSSDSINNPIRLLSQLLMFRNTEESWVAAARQTAGGGGVFRADVGVPVIVVVDAVAAHQLIEAPTTIIDRETIHGFGPTKARPDLVGEGRHCLFQRGPADRPDRQFLTDWITRRSQAIREGVQPAIDRAVAAWTQAGRVLLPEDMAGLFGDIYGTALIGVAITGEEAFAFNTNYLEANTHSGVANWIAKKANPLSEAAVKEATERRAAFRSGPLFAEAMELGASLGLDEANVITLATMAATLNATTGSSVFCGSALVRLSREPTVLRDFLAGLPSEGPISLDAGERSDAIQRTLLELHRLYQRPRPLFKVMVSDFKITDSLGRVFQLKAGENVLIHTASAQRDPAMFEAPDRLDPDRYVRNPDLQRYVYAFGAHTQVNYTCIGAVVGVADSVQTVILGTLLRDFDWSFARPPYIGLDAPWDLGPSPFYLEDFGRRTEKTERFQVQKPPGLPASAPTSFGLIDRIKLRLVRMVRAVNLKSIEQWSRRTFRRTRPRNAKALPLAIAAEHYGAGILPHQLKVPVEIPLEARLTSSYVFPYYILTGALFKFLAKFPLSSAVAWSPKAAYNRWFPPHPEGWSDIQSDAQFTALRLHGPNPFKIKRHDDGRYLVDYGPIFKGVFAPVKAWFVISDGQVVADSIEIGRTLHRPGEAGWERAKFIANGLDARETVFLRHLMQTHLVSGQAFTIAAYSLPATHTLRPFLDFFTYGTLVVNDFAFKLLVTPASYFLQTGFLRGDDVGKLFHNFMPEVSLDVLMPRKDIAQRGIEGMPGNSYVEDSVQAWDIIEDVVRTFVEKAYTSDAAVVDDKALQSWYDTLISLVPGRTTESHPLNGLNGLVEILSSHVYLNIYHEIVGDFSPYVQGTTELSMKIISMDNLHHHDTGAPRSSDVFLFTQGAWAGRFENNGNLLIHMDIDADAKDPALRECLHAMQSQLKTLDDALKVRNAERETPFLRLQPSAWKASISY